MSALGITPGGAVLLVERRGEQQVVHNALVARISMDERLAGERGEPAISAVFVLPTLSGEALRVVDDVVHFLHPDFVEGRSAFGYEELPGPTFGMCRYCGCTERRACPCVCAWVDAAHTVCSAAPCLDRYRAEMMTPLLDLDIDLELKEGTCKVMQ